LVLIGVKSHINPHYELRFSTSGFVSLLKCSAIFHVDLSNKTAGTGTLGAVIEKKLHGSTSLTYPTIAYHTFWIAALSLEKIANNMTDEIDVDNLKKVIITTASLHYGISGNIVLNDAGDRTNTDYDVWTVTKSNLDADQYIWKHDTN